MKILRSKSKVYTVALVLALTIAATLITYVPVTFGQVKIAMGATLGVLPNPVGINQSVTILGVLYPVPTVYGDVYHDLTFTITKPDTTTDTIVHDSTSMAEYDFDYVCNQLGPWLVTLSWAGDETHTPCIRSTTWTVQEEPVPPQEKIVTHAYVSARPKTVGLDQSIYIVGYITPPREIFGGLYPNLTFTITKPDTTTDTIVHHSDSPGTHSFSYVCDQTGTWSVVLSYPGYIFQQSDASEPATWTVQAEAVPPYPTTPLPTGQWGYPISAENYEWYQISGPWPQAGYDTSGSNWNPYTKAPNTPHVLWKLQTWTAGIVGGEAGYLSVGGMHPIFPIEGRASSPVVWQGRIYYSRIETVGEATGSHVLYCLDLFTGEQIYRTVLPVDPNYTIPVVGVRFAPRPATLSLELTPTPKFDPTTIELTDPQLSLWVIGSGGIWEVDSWTGNIKHFWPGASGTYHDGAIYLSNYNGTADAIQPGVMTKWDTILKRTAWTARIPRVSYYWEDILVGYSGSSSGIPFGIKITTWNATTGKLIAEGPEYPYASSDTRVVGYGKLFHHSNDRRIYALSLYTGQLVWTSEPMDAPWGAFSSYDASCGEGLVFFDSHDGYEYAYDVETGDVKWKAYTEDTGETAFGTYGTWSQTIIADDKVYFACGEHTPPNPIPRGGKLRCVDLETGEEIWSVTGFYTKAGVQSQGGVSSGILWYPSLYDGCIWFFGKGPTATTVSVQQDVVANGDSVLIKGTVTDQSPGAKDTPAISDEDMGPWMEYLYTQKPMPTDATGVPVLLQACTSNGSVIDIAWVTSDMMGHFEYLWTPPAEDTYKILASFLGSESYWMSSAETGLGVTAAPEAPTTEPTEEPAYTTIDLAIIAAVIVVAILVVYDIVSVRKLRK